MKFSGHQPHVFAAVQYLAKVRDVDVFVVSDDVKYTKDWQNRNYLIIGGKKTMITVPVTGSDSDLLCDKRVLLNGKTRRKIGKTILQSYGRLNRGDLAYEFVSKFFGVFEYEYLADLAYDQLLWFCAKLGIDTPIVRASRLPGSCRFRDDNSVDEKLVAQAKHLGCGIYVHGAGGASYMDFDVYEREGIKTELHEWEPVVYDQGVEFLSNLCVLDLIVRGYGVDSLKRKGN